MRGSSKNIIPAIHLQIRDNVLQKSSLSGVAESRSSWAQGLDLPRQAEYVFFAACGYQHMRFVEGMTGALRYAGKMGVSLGQVRGITKVLGKAGADLASMTSRMMASKEDPYSPVLVSCISVLRKLGVEVGYLQEDEPCCGSPLYYAGFEKEFSELAGRNNEIFKKNGLKKIIGLVPGCTSALRNLYPRYVRDYDIEVEHVLQVIDRRLKQVGLKPRIQEETRAVYHDPCQLSRHLEITEEPRRILNSIEGLQMLELDPERSGRWSTCCGGGGLEGSHPELAERIGQRRIEELLATGASVILTNCPACQMQLKKAARKANSKAEVADIIQFLDQALT